MFSLPDFAKVKVLDIAILSQKNRPADANPGVRLNLQADLPNAILAEFDGALRTALFTKSAASDGPRQGNLPEVEAVSDLPNLTSIARHVRKVAWTEKLTGYTVEIDHGMGGKSNLVLGDAALENWRFQAKEGGTVAAWWSVEVVDVPKVVMGELTMLKSREVPMAFREPEVRQQDVEDEPKASAPAKAGRGKGGKSTGAPAQEPWPFKDSEPPADGQLTPEKALADALQRG